MLFIRRTKKASSYSLKHKSIIREVTITYCNFKSRKHGLCVIAMEMIKFLLRLETKNLNDNNKELHSSVGLASHRYRGGHGFESR